MLEARLARLEANQRKQQTVLRGLVELAEINEKGKTMADFDFDELLDEIDETTETTDTTVRKSEEIEDLDIDSLFGDLEESPISIDDLLDEGTTITHETPGSQYEPEGTVDTSLNNCDQPDNPPFDVDPVTAKANDTEQELRDAKAEVKRLRNELKAQEKAQENEAANDVVADGDSILGDLDNAADVKQFLQELDILEQEKKVAQENISALKEDYKQQGVEVAWVIKARKEVIKEMKETTDEAEMVAKAKKLIHNDEALMDSVYQELPDN